MRTRYLLGLLLALLVWHGGSEQAGATTMVPLRTVLEEAGASFWWDGEGVTGVWPGHSLRVVPGADRAWRDGAPVPLEAPVASLNGAAFVPSSLFTDLFAAPSGTAAPRLTELRAGEQVWFAGLATAPGACLALSAQETAGKTVWLLPSLEDGPLEGLLARLDHELRQATGERLKLGANAEDTLRLALSAGLDGAVLPTMRRLGSCVVDFNPYGAYNNMLNAVKAAGYLNGTVVPPGAVFSYNAALGPRTAEKGYVVGFAFAGQKHVEALGGGVCRLSTVVYGAVLDAGLPVVERHQHSLPVGYVPLGRDATVSYGGADLKFKNNRPWPLLIEAGGTVRRITVTLWELQGEEVALEPSWPPPGNTH